MRCKFPAGYYFIPCTSNVSFVIYFGGNPYSVSLEDFVLDQISWDNRLCLGAVFGTESTADVQLWIVGNAFLKNVYTVFNATTPSVGFAYPTDNYQYLLSGKASKSSKIRDSSNAQQSKCPPRYPCRVQISLVSILFVNIWLLHGFQYLQ